MVYLQLTKEEINNIKDLKLTDSLRFHKIMLKIDFDDPEITKMLEIYKFKKDNYTHDKVIYKNLVFCHNILNDDINDEFKNKIVDIKNMI